MDIMVSITGYGGGPTSLVAFLDPATGVLAIGKGIKYRELADEGYAFVTNTRADAYDCLFTEDLWADAIREFLVGEGSETVTLMDEAARYKPRIETDSVGEAGQKYRLPEDLTNGEVAVLALVYFQKRQQALNITSSAMDDMFEIIRV